MTKLLQNKSLIKFLGIALSILLIVALVPQINVAYGSKDDVAGEDTAAETQTDGATDLAATGETEDGEEAAGETFVNEDGVEMVSHKIETSDEEDSTDPSATAAPQSDEQTTPKARKAARVQARTVLNPNDPTITIDEDTDYTTSGPLTFNGGTHTLTINKGCTFTGDILIKGGARVTINGKGTIQGTGNGSVIIVEGTGSKLTLGGNDDQGQLTGPTISGGKGTVYSEQEGQKVGGGILVKRTNTNYNDSASLLILAGTITENEAQAGGGIYVDAACGFTMDGGTVDNNTATDSEGGGIFVNTRRNHAFEDKKYAEIVKGTITNNKTETTFAWGGGGVFVNSGGALRINSALITDNTAQGLGGGVSGCPHASIAVTTVTNGAAIFGNEAAGTSYPTNLRLRLLDATSVISGNTNKVIASGDFLFDGLKAIEGIDGTDEGRWSGSNAKKTASAVFAKYGDYAKSANVAQYAQDFYCTRASYIDSTQLGNSEGNAWVGYVAGIPAVDKNSTVGPEDMERNAYFTIPVGDSQDETVGRYAALDASLGLTSLADKDIEGMHRDVVISGNTSNTHGGGVASNGALEFGQYDWSKDVFETPDSLVLQKQIVNSLDSNKEIGEKDDKGNYHFSENERFSFTLYNDKNEEIGKATSDENGRIVFGNIFKLTASDFVGNNTKVSKTLSLTLKEEPKEGYDSSKSSWTIEVALQGTKVESNFLTAGDSLHKSTVYDTKVTSVKVDGKETNTVTNTLILKTSEQIEVTKIAKGIPGENTFSFNLKKIDNINSVVDNVDDPKTLNEDLASLTSDNPTVESVEMEDSTTKQEQGTATFDLGEFVEPGTHWYAIAEAKGETKDISYDDTAYLVKVDVTLFDDGRSLKTAKTTWKSEAGSKDLTPVDANKIEFKNVGIKYYDFGFDLTKQILTTLDIPLNFGDDRSFAFELRDENGKAVVSVKDVKPTAEDEDQSKAKIHFDLGKDYVEKAYLNGGEATLNFTLIEANAGEKNMAYIPEGGLPVTVIVKTKAARYPVENPTELKVEADSVTVKVDGQDDTTITNRYTPNGTWQFKADKYFYGLGKPQGKYSFTMQEVERAPKAGEALSTLLVANDSLEKQTKTVEASAFNEGKAAVAFDPIQYKVEAPKAQDADEAIPTDQDDRGNHYYLVTEDGDGVKDTTAYVVKVTVAENPNNPGNLTTDHAVVGYADDLDSPFIAYTEKESTSEPVAFYNSDTFGMVSAASYSVYAASGEPADQVCYVDPKIHKNLEGRAIKSGEFAFKLIEVNNYTDTEGTQISATVNDEFGMVDFDKANPVNGDLENPSCLAYTKPHTYYYRVIEDTSKGGMKDQSVLYSDQIITFTTVIEQNKATGQLECTDMYYGYWDAAAGKNVRFDEQYLDYDKQPANIGDMAKLNPDWHPTITNKTRPMDLQVRKTSVTDRNEGLVGATYALYMVNGNAQGDIYLTEATSEEGGWITYKNVSLSTNNLYYFKETAAPAGHTVSEFRSPYFYLVEDASSANGYALKYTDTKTLPTDAAAQPPALAETGAEAVPMAAAAAEAQAAENETATDPNAQPGYSADGSILLTYDKDGGVADEATELQVSKLDTRTHEWVEGAELLILEKDTGKEIASWTSGKAPEKLQKTLNVDTTYILREFKAPKDYRLANDVEFVIDNYGNVSITKGTENGNAELSDNTINLYDTMMDAEEVVTQQREKTREVPTADTLLAKTGDMLPLLGIGIVALAALVVLAIAIRRRRAEKGDDTQA